MNPKILNRRQLHNALLKCNVQLSAMIARTLGSNAHAVTIGQTNRAEFHDLVVHALGLLRGTVPSAESYRTMISRAYAGSVHHTEGAPTIVAVRAIIAVINTVASSLDDIAEPAPDQEKQMAVQRSSR